VVLLLLLPQAADRLAEMNEREELVGRLEGRYKLLGREMPFGVRNKPVPELKLILKQLRAEQPQNTTTKNSTTTNNDTPQTPKKP
jgi:hypothetical protein